MLNQLSHSGVHAYSLKLAYMLLLKEGLSQFTSHIQSDCSTCLFSDSLIPITLPQKYRSDSEPLLLETHKKFGGGAAGNFFRHVPTKDEDGKSSECDGPPSSIAQSSSSQPALSHTVASRNVAGVTEKLHL